MLRSPSGDGGSFHIQNLIFGYAKFVAKKHTSHSHTQQQWSENAVDAEQCVVEFGAVHITHFAPIFVGNGLNHETQQNEHPQPVGATETGGIEQGEGGEKGAAKGHQGGESEFPFSAHGMNHERAVVGIFHADEHRLSALHEKQKHKQGSQYGDNEPPIVLKKFVCHNRQWFTVFKSCFDFTDICFIMMLMSAMSRAVKITANTQKVTCT